MKTKPWVDMGAKAKAVGIAVLLSGLSVLAASIFLPVQAEKFSFFGLTLGLLLLLLAFYVFRLSQELQTRERDDSQSIQLVKRLQASVNVADHNLSDDESLTDALRSVAEGIAASRKRERAIIENAADVICVIDVNARFLSVSPSAEKVWGYSQNELLGHTLEEFLEGGRADQSLSAVFGAQASIDQIVFENRLRHKNGALLDISWSAHWSASDNGLFCVAHDITKRKQAELQVQESEQRLRTTMEAMPVAIACTNTLGFVEYANQNLEELFEMKSIDFMGKSLSDLFGSQGAYVHSYLTQGNGASTLETQLERSAGERVDLELSLRRFVMKGQNKLLVTISDISYRKQVEVRKQQFVSMVNHDLRTPLASLAGMFSMLRRGAYGDLNEGGIKICDLADAELDRLLRLVGELLDLDKFEAGQFPLSPDLVSAQDIIEASVASVNAFAELKKIRIVYGESELACFCDRSRCVQVLVNLLSNAIKFSPTDSEIKLEVEELNDAVKFSVEDQGPGIPAEKQDLIFDRFKQANPENEVERTGSGLGLAISKAIIEAHGGKIACQNQTPRGSCFWFTVPKRST